MKTWDLNLKLKKNYLLFFNIHVKENKDKLI